MDEILWCDHSNEISSAVLSHGTIYIVCSSNFWVCRWDPMMLPFKWNLFSSTFTSYIVCFSNFWVCGWDPMVLPFKWNLFSSTFTWCYLYSTFFELSSLWMKSYDVTIQIKPLQQYFHMVLLFYLVCLSNFWVCRWNPMKWWMA